MIWLLKTLIFSFDVFLPIIIHPVDSITLLLKSKNVYFVLFEYTLHGQKKLTIA